MLALNVSVRGFASLMFRAGDLHSRQAGRAVSAEEGLSTQTAVQKIRLKVNPDYETERRLSVSVDIGKQSLKISGRADGVLVDAQLVLIEEFKTCAHVPEDPDSIDFGQLFLYGALLANEGVNKKPTTIELKLVYVEVDTLDEKHFTWRYTPNQLIAEFHWLCALYSILWRQAQTRALRRRRWAQDLAFPLPEFRPGQQMLARRVYQSLRDREDLLLEAPTGAGKSLGVLYPAIRAQLVGEQIFFMTGRNSGREAALNAMALIDPGSKYIHLVDITAKEKICFVEGMPCDPELCRYAKGYFDKLGDALKALSDAGKCDRAALEAIADKHEVCPFELSLDAASAADVVIGDYNYIYDPVVRLQRFVGAKHMGLLVDEAHQLVPRARDMLSVSLSRTDVIKALKIADGEVAARLRSLDRALLKYKKGQKDGSHALEDFSSIDRSIKKFLKVMTTLEDDLVLPQPLIELHFACARWQKSHDWLEASELLCQITLKDKSLIASRLCVDPARYIAKVSDEYAVSVRFSATLSPLSLSAAAQGFTGARAERAQNPFSPSQLGVYVVSDISTYFKHRESSLEPLASLLTEVYDVRPGRYLVVLPSYNYLDMLLGVLRGKPVPLFEQRPAMSQLMLEELLGNFGRKDGFLLAVMGGSLSESLDFQGARLDGVVAIGMGLPPPTLLRDRIADGFATLYGRGAGQTLAYTQPALVKILQSAGRLIRDTEDRGILCLIDPRFRKPFVQQFFPEHWHVKEVSAHKVAQHVREFWS